MDRSTDVDRATQPAATKDRAPEARPDPDVTPGRFRARREVGGLSAEQQEEFARLETLGYLSGSMPASGLSGVTQHDRSRAHQGLNFYVSGHAAEAVLMDMDGQVLHSWRADIHDIWPDLPEQRRELFSQFWRRAHLYPNGDILAIWENLGIAKFDKDSQLLWARQNSAHHDLDVTLDGSIHLLTSEVRLTGPSDGRESLREDFISVIAADGRELERFSVLDALIRGPHRHLWTNAAQHTGDALHTNALEVLDGRIADRVPAFKRGNLLISILQLDTIAVIDRESKTVVWAHQGDFRRQHDPRILANGNLLVFDNNRARDAHPTRAGQSRVLEFDPAKMKTVWSYSGSGASPFYSKTCGTAERLPGGNTLITESDNGRAFEITSAGEIVWEFYNPNLTGDDDEFIATLLEVQRLEPDFAATWLD